MGKAIEYFAEHSTLPEAAELVQKALIVVQEIRHVMLELLIECPRCNGARGSIGRNSKDNVTYTPCPMCRGLGVLTRQGPQ
jgi:hypothetical protein